MSSYSSEDNDKSDDTSPGSTPGKLLSGVYIAGRAVTNDAGAETPGTHEFLVLVPFSPDTFQGQMRDLGNGTLGIVLGAYNISGRLQSAPFAASDSGMLRGYLRGAPGGFRFEIKNVDLGGCYSDPDDPLRRIINVASRYNANESARAMPYPPLGGLLTPNCLNSNSWAQSVLSNALGPGAVVPDDFSGFARCSSNRIDDSYFK